MVSIPGGTGPQPRRLPLSWASPMSTRTRIRATRTHEHSLSRPLTRSMRSHDTYDIHAHLWTFRSLGPSSRHIHSHTNSHEGPSELWLRHPPEVPDTSHSLLHTRHSPATLRHRNPSSRGPGLRTTLYTHLSCHDPPVHIARRDPRLRPRG